MSDSMPAAFPEAFTSRMKRILGEEFPAFSESLCGKRTYGLRVNTSRISCKDFERLCPFPVRKIPWIPGGYFYEEDARPAKYAYYHAGLYYLQDPAAMTPASRLAAAPGEKVLDLCAAPGGKATALGDALRGQGLLVANDISTTRARSLLRNLELSGVPNLFVANERPDRLAGRFTGFFDRIMLDAPCSGEGMFRKEEALLKDWSPEKSLELSGIQKELLTLCCRMLRPGGTLMYSTCTFAPEEDEEVMLQILSENPEMEELPLEWYEGFAPGLHGMHCARIYPHRMEGEGQFLGLLGKREGEDTGSAKRLSPGRPRVMPKREKGLLLSLFDEIGLQSFYGRPFDFSRVEIRNEKVFYLPDIQADFSGITFLRNGLYLGELKKDRFEPSRPFALALRMGDVSCSVSLSVTDDRLMRYLRGESIELGEGESRDHKGWILLCADDYPLAFGKLVNRTLKNKMPAGWRI